MKNYAVPIFILIGLITFPHLGIADYPDGDYAVSHIINGDTFVLADVSCLCILAAIRGKSPNSNC